MRSMQWQLGMFGTISAFAYRHRETKKNLCRGGRSQDLPNTDFQPPVRHLNKKQQYTHSATNTQKTTTTIHIRKLTVIHTRQLEQYTQDNYNNTHKKTNSNTHKTTTTLHTRQLATIHTRQLTTIHRTNNNNIHKTTNNNTQDNYQ